jgi:hypothetical protein
LRCQEERGHGLLIGIRSLTYVCISNPWCTVTNPIEQQDSNGAGKILSTPSNWRIRKLQFHVSSIPCLHSSKINRHPITQSSLWCSFECVVPCIVFWFLIHEQL